MGKKLKYDYNAIAKSLGKNFANELTFEEKKSARAKARRALRANDPIVLSENIERTRRELKDLEERARRAKKSEKNEKNES